MIKPYTGIYVMTCLLGTAVGCSDAPTTRATNDQDASSVSALCRADKIETDLGSGPAEGPAVDSGGQIETGGRELVVSTTYLHLKGDQMAQRRFDELIAPIGQALRTQEGLLAVQFGQSTACGTQRTLAVWRDESAMIAFVTGPAHAAAAAAIGELDAGGSTVTHWKASDRAAMAWPEAAKRFAAISAR